MGNEATDGTQGATNVVLLTDMELFMIVDALEAERERLRAMPDPPPGVLLQVANLIYRLTSERFRRALQGTDAVNAVGSGMDDFV